VSFFGINAKGERIAFIVDLSRSMVEDEKGGLDGIVVLKDELKKMVEKLNDGTFSSPPRPLRALAKTPG